jgi:zinc transporter 1/2/3
VTFVTISFVPHVQEAHGSDHLAASMLRNASTLGDSVLLIVALCFHSVFEGIVKEH